MIICPNCKEEIEELSYYCDQCGQKLVYCQNCGRVGMGRRCTFCGGLMMSADELQQQESATQSSMSVSGADIPMMFNQAAPEKTAIVTPAGIPSLTLYNPTLDIRIVGMNGAIIGRRQGPYQQMFANKRYVSGVHAQLIYKPTTGWCIIDKNSSNGTKLNQRDLQPDVPMSMKSGDIVTIANINLQVSIS